MRGLKFGFGTHNPVVLFKVLYEVLCLIVDVLQVRAKDEDIVHILDHNGIFGVQPLYIHGE